MITVIFSHGKESGPDGTKIKFLMDIVEKKSNMRAISIDYRDLEDPDLRVARLINESKNYENIILVGSSMGGYASICASEVIRPDGLFLLAPALYINGYANQDPKPVADLVHIIFGYNDEVIPVENCIKFGLKHKVPLTLIPSDHRLTADIEYIGNLFNTFLENFK